MLDMDDKALAMFKKSGDEAGAFNNMGDVYQMKGERKKAIEMYRKAIDLNPDFVVARKNLDKIVGEKRTTEY